MPEAKWIYHAPMFECDNYNADMLLHSPWAGHRCFGYDYVSNMKPDRIVELGSYYGCSSFAFLQAIKDNGLDTAFYAVDTWCGDSFTENDYREDIYGAYKQINDACFGGQNSRMIRKTFDEACDDFIDGSIDLLHIDGSHNYDDVKNDFTRWRRKVSADGVVFFHDVGRDLLFGEPMGSHLYWLEIKELFPWTLEFSFSNGLGLLFFSEERYRQFGQMVDMDHYQQLLNLQDTVNKDLLRKNHFEIRDLNIHNTHLQGTITDLNAQLERYRQDHDAILCYQRELVDRLEQNDAQTQQFLESKECYIHQLEGQISELNEFVAAKERYICQLETQIEELKSFAGSKETYILQLQEQARENGVFLAAKEDYIRQLEAQIQEFNAFAESKERYILQLQEQAREIGVFLDSKENYIHQLEAQMKELSAFVASKEDYIRQLEAQMKELNDFVALKENYIQQLQEQARDHSAALVSEAERISRLEAQLMESNAIAASREADILRLEQQGQWLRTQLQCSQGDLQELLRRLEKIPFGSMLLRNLPSHSSHQEGQ